MVPRRGMDPAGDRTEATARPLGMGRGGSGRFGNRPSKPQPDPTNTPPRRLRLPYRRLLPGSLPITQPSHRPLRPRPLHPRTRPPPRRSPQHPNPTRPQFPDRTGISPEPGYRTWTDGSGHRSRTTGHRPRTAQSFPSSPTRTPCRPTRPPRHPTPYTAFGPATARSRPMITSRYRYVGSSERHPWATAKHEVIQKSDRQL